MKHTSYFQGALGLLLVGALSCSSNDSVELRSVEPQGALIEPREATPQELAQLESALRVDRHSEAPYCYGQRSGLVIYVKYEERFYFCNGSDYEELDRPQGPRGADGAQGAAGPAGPPGVDGVDGAPGPQCAPSAPPVTAPASTSFLPIHRSARMEESLLS